MTVSLSDHPDQLLERIDHHQRLDHLDALRGLGALMVISLHYNLCYGLPYNNWLLSETPLHLWWDGLAGVSLFFVLSGLVLSLGHFKKRDIGGREIAYAGYIVSRICRILLPYLAALLLSAIVWRFSGRWVTAGPARSPFFYSLWPERPTLQTLLRQANLFQSHNHFTLLPQAWSLAVEIVLSLLVPLCLLVADRNVAWLLFGSVIATALGGLLVYSVHFAIGITLAKYYYRIVGWLEPRRGWRIALASIGAMFFGYRYIGPPDTPLHYGNIDWYAEAIGAGFVLMISSASPRARTVLSRGIVHHVGRISYSLYLCHFAVLVAATPRFMAVVSTHIKLPWLVLWAMGLMFTCTLGIASAEVLHRLVEVPSIELGRWLSRRTTDFVSTRLGGFPFSPAASRLTL